MTPSIFRMTRKLPALGLRRTPVCLLLLMPLAALVGPTLAIPGLRSFYGYRLLVVAYLVLAGWWCIHHKARVRPEAIGFLVLYASWFAWLCLTSIWAADKARVPAYLLSFLLLGFLAVATASAGLTRQRLRFLFASLGFGYLLVVAVATIESATRLHLPTSMLAGGRRGASSFFYNPNDLGSFLAICWPFLLLGLFEARRRVLLILNLVAIGGGAWALIGSASRSALLAVALETLAAAVLLIAQRRRGARIVAALIALVIIAGIGILSASGSGSKLNPANLIREEHVGRGSGAVRLQLQSAGLRAVARTYFLGVGPGNAEKAVRSANSGLRIANLHDWWLEVLVDGGLPALLLYLAIYSRLSWSLLKIARRSADGLTRYLASATMLALVGLIVGSFGPSTMINFLPLGILFGLGLAVLVRDKRAGLEEGVAATGVVSISA